MFAFIPYDVWLAAAIAEEVEVVGDRPSRRASGRRRDHDRALRLYRRRGH